MPVIKVLPKSISELINAGEVVDRPASIIKELVENSLDASAKKITVEIRHGGITYLSVKDDGSGIYKDELPTAFIRHATSKIASIEDLEKIGTMGFRGEALPSIAAVSKVVLSSKPKDQKEGWQYNTETGEISLCPMSDGTKIVVTDLFFNTPARMKFLKRDVTEANAVTTLLERLALSNPQVSFTFIRDGKTRIKTFGDGSLLASVRSVLSSDVSNFLREVAMERNGIKVTGLISVPPFSRQSRALETFFINRRFVHSKTCQAAIEEAYKNRLMSGKFPVCFLNLEMDFSLVDVNIHPAKLEVRFQNERDVYNAVYSCCLERLDLDFKEKNLSPIQKINPFSLNDFDHRKEQLSISSLVKEEPVSFSFNSVPNTLSLRDETSILPNLKGENPLLQSFKLREGKLDIEVEEPFVPKKPEILSESLSFKENSQALKKEAGEALEKEQAEKAEQQVPADSLKENDKAPDYKFPKEKNEADLYEETEKAPSDILQSEEIPAYRIIGEVFKTYILIEKEDDFILIDKHAAHEGYIYHSIKDSFLPGSFCSQLSLVPTAVSLTPEEYFSLCENMDVLKGFNIKAEAIGNNTFMVFEIPQVLEGCTISTIISDIAEGVLKGKKNPTPDYFDRLIYSVSCRSATMAGIASHMPELEALADMCLKKGISFCPHGRPCKMVISKSKLDKMFGRLGAI